MQRLKNIRLRLRTVLLLAIGAALISCGAMYLYQRHQQHITLEQHYGCGTTADGNTICS